MQEQKKELWRNGNLKLWTCLHMFRQVPHPQKVRLHPNVSGYSQLQEKPESKMRRNSKSDAASSFEVRLRDGYLGGFMAKATGQLVATKEESGDVDLAESDTWCLHEKAATGRAVAYKTVTVKPYAPSQSACQGRPKAENTEWSHTLRVSPATIDHSEAVFSIVRRIYRQEHDDPMDHLDVNMPTWGIFLKPLFQQQSILNKTMTRIYITWRIIFGKA